MYSLQTVHKFKQKYKEMDFLGFTRILRENNAKTQVSHINDFEASKLGGTIEWQ